MKEIKKIEDLRIKATQHEKFLFLMKHNAIKQFGYFILSCPKCRQQKLYTNYEVFVCMSCSFAGEFELLESEIIAHPDAPELPENPRKAAQ